MSNKLPRGVDEAFVDSINSMSTEDLCGLVVILQTGLSEVEAYKQAEVYQQASETYRMVVGPVRDAATSLKNKTKLVIERLKERGAV